MLHHQCRANYCNFELLVHLFQQKQIDLSKADVFRISTAGVSQSVFEKFIKQQDFQSAFQRDLMSDKVQELQKLDRELLWKMHSNKVNSMYAKLADDPHFRQGEAAKQG